MPHTQAKLAHLYSIDPSSTDDKGLAVCYALYNLETKVIGQPVFQNWERKALDKEICEILARTRKLGTTTLLAVDVPVVTPHKFVLDYISSKPQDYPFDVQPFATRPCDHALRSLQSRVNRRVNRKPDLKTLTDMIGALCNWKEPYSESNPSKNWQNQPFQHSRSCEGVSVMIFFTAPHQPIMRVFRQVLEDNANIEKGCDLRLMPPVNDVSGIPTSLDACVGLFLGLIIVVLVGHVLHFRVFDRDGNVVVNTDEKRLTEQALLIEDLKYQLESLWPPHKLTECEKLRVIAAVTSIIGHTPRISYSPQEAEQLNLSCLYVLESHPAVAMGFWTRDKKLSEVPKYKRQITPSFHKLVKEVKELAKELHEVDFVNIDDDDQLDACVGLLNLLDLVTGKGDWFGTSASGYFLVPQLEILGGKLFSKVWEVAEASVRQANQQQGC